MKITGAILLIATVALSASIAHAEQGPINMQETVRETIPGNTPMRLVGRGNGIANEGNELADSPDFQHYLFTRCNYAGGGMETSPDGNWRCIDSNGGVIEDF